MAIDDANFLCTLADVAALGGVLLYTFFGNSAISFSSPLTAAASAVGASCTARVFALFHQFWNFLVTGLQMCGKDCRTVCFDNGNTDIGSAGVDTQIKWLYHIVSFVQQLNGKRF